MNTPIKGALYRLISDETVWPHLLTIPTNSYFIVLGFLMYHRKHYWMKVLSPEYGFLDMLISLESMELVTTGRIE